MEYIYPDNLKAKPKLFLWELKDVAIIGILGIISVFSLAQTGLFAPLIVAFLYAFLSIQFDGTSILSFLKNASSFFIFKQQEYDWST